VPGVNDWLRKALWAGALGLSVAVSGAEVRADPAQPAAGGGYLGVGLRAVPGGLRVEEVAEGSPAAQSGIAVGDVIVRARGFAPGSVEAFTLSVRAQEPGQRFALVLRRGAATHARDVVLAAAPRAAARGGAVQVGVAAPALGASSVAQGNDPVDLARLRGRVVLLDFWATWCGPCRMIMPMLNGLSTRYSAQGLTVLGLSDEPAPQARSFAQRMGVGYTLASSPASVATYGIHSLPTLVFIDRRGVVREVSVGVSSPQALEDIVVRLLAEPAP
jgi:thiol-disulfide isomerase/thioredoxin